MTASNQRPRVSVALCSFNGEKFIEEQLASIAGQTIAHEIELVVCDDGSTDRTPAILARFAESASFPVRVVRNKAQAGVLLNFVRSFELCEAPLIAYCDQDDVWQPRKLEECVAVLVRDPGIALVSHASAVTDQHLKDTGVRLPEKSGNYTWPRQHLPLGYWGFGHQMVFSSRIVPLIRYLTDGSPEGLEVYYKNLDRLIPLCAGVFGGIAFLNTAFTMFRRHSSSVSPAAKRDDAAATSRWDQNLRSLLVIRDAVEGMRRLIAAHSKDEGFPIPSQVSESYLRYLRALDERVHARLRVLQSSGRLASLLSLSQALASGAYASEPRLGFGMRQFLIDSYLVGTRSRW